MAHAVERIEAAVEAAGRHVVITARCENFLHERPDLADTIARLQRYQEAGAHVLYAPGVTTPEQIRAVVSSVDRPVNVLALPGTPPVAELAELGVARISVGGAFAFAALSAAVEAGRELLDEGTYSFWERVKPGRDAARRAFG
jgi:2-methylisocitrate lyase-like PEP mutase family enzyme